MWTHRKHMIQMLHGATRKVSVLWKPQMILAKNSMCAFDYVGETFSDWILNVATKICHPSRPLLWTARGYCSLTDFAIFKPRVCCINICIQWASQTFVLFPFSNLFVFNKSRLWNHSRSHLKPKTGISIAPQKGTMFSKTNLKKSR